MSQKNQLKNWLVVSVSQSGRERIVSEHFFRWQAERGKTNQEKVEGIPMHPVLHRDFVVMHRNDWDKKKKKVSLFDLRK